MSQKQRIGEIDFLKSVCILLMIAFHLVFIGRTYPVAKAFVYTFHMPVFLLISGYFSRVSPSQGSPLRPMCHLFVPYALMETLYVVAASLLPVYEHIDHLTPLVLLDKVFLHPIGPYWYLHTLILCTLLCHFLMQAVRLPVFLRLLLTAIAYWFCDRVCGVVVLSNALYFLFGVLLRQAGIPFLSFFPARWWTALPLAAVVACVCVSPMSQSWLVSEGLVAFDRASLGGILLVWSVVGVLLFLYRFASPRLRRCSTFIGRNTLLMLLFSPVFTILAKSWQPWMTAFEPTGILFAFVSVAVAVAGSLLVGWFLQRLHLSRYLFVALKR